MNIDEAISWVEEKRRKQRENVEKAATEASGKFFKTAVKKIEKCFTDSVDAFYSDYEPIHPKCRTYQMYDILKTETKTSTNNPTMRIGFDPSQMSFRNGYAGEDGLYNQAFRKGWHGGAASGPFHPNPGLPLTRAPYGGYYRWYYAATTGKPPIDDFWERVEKYWLGGEASSDFWSAFDRCKGKYGL